MSDATSNAARYAAARESGEDPSSSPGSGPSATPMNAANKAAFIETAIQSALRRGEFDDLPGAGKPLEGLGTHHDPDWWIRRKIETEKLTGLGPPALRLRVEDKELNNRLDRIAREAEARELLEDFNRQVIEARRQLQGGPPVVTALRDIDAELVAWAERRASRAVSATATRHDHEQPPRRRTRRWFRR